MIDVDALLAPIPGDAPCGLDLEYDPVFLALEQASKGRAEQQFGDTVIEAQGADWREVRKLCEALFERTKDLRVAVLFARSLVRTEGLPAVVPTFELLGRLVGDQWEGVHPQLDPEDDNDPLMRCNALAPLGDADGLIKDLREVQLCAPRGRAPLTVRDVEIAMGRLPAREGMESPNQGMVESMFVEQGAEFARRIGACFQAYKTFANVLNDRFGEGRGPDLKALQGVLYVLDSVASKVCGEEPSDLPAEGAVGAGEAPMGVAAAPRPIAGEIMSRQDALVMIDKIVSYLERSEPTNPAPLLLKRARKLMTMSFVDIIRELAPDSMDRIGTIAGIPAEEE